MRSLATLGGVLVLIVLAIAWKISNQVEAGQEPDPNAGQITLGVQAGEGDGSGATPAAGGQRASGPPAATEAPETGQTEVVPGADDPSSSTGGTDVTGRSDPGTPAEEVPSPATSGAEQPTQTEQAAAQGPPGAEVPTAVRYLIQEGDTLYSILMRAYGSADQALIDAITDANALDDPGAIAAGDPLLLPRVDGYSAPQRP